MRNRQRCQRQNRMALQKPDIHHSFWHDTPHIPQMVRQTNHQRHDQIRHGKNRRPRSFPRLDNPQRRIRLASRPIRVGCNQTAKLHGSTTNSLQLKTPESSTVEKILLTPLQSVYTMNPMKGISLKQHWHCPRCKVSVTTYITLSTPPQHRCLKAANQPKPLQPSEGASNE